MMARMKSDFYLKAVLTVIALAVVILAVRPAVNPNVVGAQRNYDMVSIGMSSIGDHFKRGIAELKGRTVVGFSCPDTKTCHVLVQ